MKTITFYNDKGGVGKTSFSILYASWLHYKHGIKVAVADMNNRIKSYRDDELSNKKKLNILDKYDIDKSWPLYCTTAAEMKKYLNQNLPYSLWINEKISNGNLNNTDVLIIDMPGGNPKVFNSIFVGKHIGLFIIPTDKSSMTMSSTISLYRFIKSYTDVNYKMAIASFINQIQTYIPYKKYQNIADLCIRFKLPILPDMVSFSERMRALDKNNIIVSTLEYPDWNNVAFRGSRDLGIENLLIDVTKLLKNTPDHQGTTKTDLSFVDSLQKEFREDRQLTRSSFPDFEFPRSMFSEERLSLFENK